MRFSYSKYSKVEQCGLAYYRHYELGERGPSSDPLRKGSLVHEVLEVIARVAVKQGYSGPLDLGKVLKLHAKLWAEHYPDGGSSEHFSDTEQILSEWVERTGTVDASKIVAIEERFTIELDSGDSILGFIDIIERDGNGRLVIKDYKTNRAMYTREEVDSSMQLGIYALAASKLWPDEDVVLCYDMLRHGYSQYTQRTKEELDTLERYLGTLGARVRKWANEGVYPATLNTLCGWCAHKDVCPAYQGALEVGELEGIDPQDWEALAAERERLAAIEKLTRGRKYEIDSLIRTRCKEEGDLLASGRVYSLSKTTKRTHDPAKAALVLTDALGGEPAEWLERISTVSSSKLKRVIKDSDLDRSGKIVLEAKLDGVASTRASAMLRSSKAKE